MKLRTAVAALAIATLGGSIAPALAEVTAETAAAQLPATEQTAPTQVELPRFVPSAELASQTESELVTIQPLPEETDEGRSIGSGVASWYGPGFAGRRTASGERFDPGEMTAAHRTLPFGSQVRVTHNGRSVVVRINDRGPFHGGRVIDLSQAAADQIGIRRAGSGRVDLAVISE